MSNQRTIRASVMRVALITTFVALLINAIALIVLDLLDYREARIGQIRTQAELLIRASEAAVAFNDQKEAGNALQLLRADPGVLAAAVYLPDGRLFVSHSKPQGKVPAKVAGPSGFAIVGERISGFYSVNGADGISGTVYLSAYFGLYDRLYQYLWILVIAMISAFGIAVVLSTALQHTVTRPVVAVTRAARRVLESHDYTVRAEPQPGYETGVLADAFNEMLAEIQRRAETVRHEIHEREEAENALREADRRKDRFLATLAHELRNPLAPIMSAVQVLHLPGASDVDRARACEVIDRQVRQMSRLLDDLLDVGRITNDKLELRKQPVMLSSVVESAVESSRPLIERAGHTLQLDMAEEPVQLDADPIRIAQVLSNLLNNAAKYTHAGGRIALRARYANGFVEIIVEDNGIGMDREELDKLFDMFAQSPSGAHLSRGGLGIGLFLVKALTDMHGGTVAAHSDGPGKGSRFVVRLPALIASVAERPALPPQVAVRCKSRILIVDDNGDAAEALAAALRIDGNEVRTSFDGRSALEVMQSFSPQIAFIDIGMPGLNGYELARTIRATENGSRMRLVALTGWGRPEDRRMALESGFDDHLTKPAGVEAIQAVLLKHAGLSHA